MRFFEMLRRDKRFTEGFTKGLSGIPVIDCDQVAEWYCCHTTQELWSIDDFPILAPPWPRAWFDFKAPPYILMSDGRKITWESHQPDYWGIDCRWRDATVENLIEACSRTASLWGNTIRIQEQWIKDLRPRWFLDQVLFWHRTRENQGPIWLQRLYIDKDGHPMKNAQKQTLAVEGPLVSDLVKIKFEYAKAFNCSLDSAEQYLFGQFASFFHNSCLSISFLHCKNIKIQEVEVPKQKPPTNAQKRRGDILIRPINYKVLEITPMKKILQRTASEQHTGGGKTLHFVKGHFHEYSDDAPLFGKPGLTGKYFIPMHIRGDIENGITVKDYKIKKPL